MKKCVRLLPVAIIALFFNSIVANAQEEVPAYSQYMFNMLALNPAYAGSHDLLTINCTFRKQWVGVPGSPQTAGVSMDMPSKNGFLGLGLQLTDDVIGIQHSTALTASYAVRLRMGFEQDHVLALGIQAGINNLRADYNQVDLVNPYDPVFIGNKINEFFPSFGAGIYYNTPSFYIGLSTPDLVKTYLKKSSITQNAPYRFQYTHYFLTTGYVFDVSETIAVKPSLLIKASPGIPVQLDLNTNVWFNDIISVGASYRIKDAVVGMLELQVSPSMRIGYAYDHTISSIGQFAQGTHEIMFRFDITNDQRRTQSPRYF